MKLKNLLRTAPAFGLLAFTGCSLVPGWKTVTGDGRIVSQARDVGQFDEVSVSGSGELSVSQGSEESLIIETDENFLPLIKSEVSNGHLWIGPRDVNLRPSKGIFYKLKLKNLKALQLSGSVNAKAAAIKTEDLALGVSGSGRIQVVQLEAKQLSAHISGSGAIAVAGEVVRQDIHISGSGSQRASELKCSQAEAQISGSGHAVLLVKDALRAHISGSGEVAYYGSPQVTRQVSGSGQVRQLGDNRAEHP
jgi:hypothetical protein